MIAPIDSARLDGYRHLSEIRSFTVGKTAASLGVRKPAGCRYGSIGASDHEALVVPYCSQLRGAVRSVFLMPENE